MDAMMDRRAFLNGSIIGGAAAAAAGLSLNTVRVMAAEQSDDASASSVDDYPYVDTETSVDGADYDVDVLVAGSGLGGLACAIESANNGYNVLLVESEQMYGGATSGAEGIICLHSDLLDELGESDRYDTEEVLKHEYEASDYAANYEILSKFVHAIDDDYEWLKTNGVEFDGCETFNPCQHFYKGGGEAMVETLVQKAQDLGVTCLLNTRLRRVVQTDDKIVGAVVETEDGEQIVKAKAIVLATGCFLKDKAMIERKFPWVNPDRIVIMATGGNYGDGQNIAAALGGDTHSIVTPQLYDPILKEFPFYSDLSVAGCNTPYLFVNEQGNRFINEDLTIRYSEICLAIFSQRRVISILTQSAVDRIMTEGCPVGWAAYVKTGTKLTDLQNQLDQAIEEQPDEFYWADSWDELAEKTGLPADNLKATVERYRELVAKGEDTDFGKDPKYLWEVPEGERLYAFELRSWFGNAFGGIVINDKQQVVRSDGTPVDGVYAAGAGCSGAAGFLYSSDYPSTKQGFCCYSGREAARQINEYLG